MTPFGPSPWDDPLTYASGWPAASCWLRGERLEPLDDVAAAIAGRHAVLAVGSNGSPAQLHRKLGPTELPLLRVRATGVQPTHVAWAATYGAVPTTATSGNDTELIVTLLDDEQLAVIDHTEGPRYDRRRLDPGLHPVLDVASGIELRDVDCYCSGGEVLADPATREPVGLLPQRELWEWLLVTVPRLRDVCGPTPEAATAALAADPQRRGAFAVLLIQAGATTPVCQPA